MPGFEPAYTKAYHGSRLRRNIEAAGVHMSDCTLGPRMCRVDRLSGETGFCRTGRRALVSSFNAHFGEEAPLVGANGSGTIFFTFCNLLCLFCQNFEISHEGIGEEVSDEQLPESCWRCSSRDATTSISSPQAMSNICAAW